MCDYTRIDKIHNDYIHKQVKVTLITKKIVGNHLNWFGYNQRVIG